MSKYVISADWHIGLSEGHDECIRRGVEHIAEVCEKEDADFIFAGDLFDRPRPSPEDYRLAGDCLGLIECKQYIISGNHDRTGSKGVTVHAFQSNMFTRHANVYIAGDEPARHEPRDHELILAPFVHDQEGRTYGDVIIEHCKEIGSPDEDIPRILVAHADIPGAMYGAEQEIQLGRVGSLPPMHEYVDVIIAGHIHRHQTFRYGPCTVIYPGALSRTSHTEEKEYKGFILFDTETQDVKFVRRKDARKYHTVKIKWPGQFRMPAALAKADGCVRLQIDAARRYSGMIDRRAIEKKLAQKFDEVKLEINYERKVSASAKAVATGRGFDDYEELWLKENVASRLTTVRKLLMKYLKQVDTGESLSGSRTGVILKRVRIKNYQSIDEVEIDLTSNDCVGILGEIDGKLTKSNGAGKSSILEAIRFAMNGETRWSKNEKAIRRGTDSADVEIDMENGSGVYTVHRTLKARGATAWIRHDGEQLARGPNEVTKWFEDNFGASKKFFDTLIWIGTKRRSALLEARPQERLKAIQEPLPLGRYEKALKLIRSERTSAKSKVDAAQGVIEAFGNMKQSDVTKAETELSGLTNKRKMIEDQIKVLNTKLKSHDIIARDQDKLDELIDELEECRDEFKDCPWLKQSPDVYVRETRKVLDGLDSVSSQMLADLSQLDAGIKLAELKRNEAQEAIDTLFGKSQCPTCNTKLKPDAYKATMQEKNDELKKHSDDCEIYIQKYHELDIKFKSNKKKIDDLNGRKLWAEGLVKTQKRIDTIQPRIDELRAKHDYSALKGIKKLEKDHETLERNRRTTSDAISDKRAEIDSIKKDLERLQKAKTELKSAEQLSQDLNVVYEACSPRGIPSLVCSEIIKEINETIPDVVEDYNFWQDIQVAIWEMTDGNIVIEAAIDDEELNEVEGLSEGEREIVNLILMSTWKRVLESLLGSSYNVILIDEALDKMDEENRKRAVKYYGRVKQQSLVISHSNIRDSFSKTLIVSR